MGRTTPSQPNISPTQRRDARAKRAKVTVNKDIPALLQASPKARQGIEGVRLVVNPELGFNLRRAGETEVSSKGGERRKGKGKGRTPSIATDMELTLDDGNDDEQRGTIRANGFADDTDEKTLSRVNDARTGVDRPGASRKQPHIRVQVADTLGAAHSLITSLSDSYPQLAPAVTVLNMASPLRPGGGFLTGATSQEESLCMRTTLYPSLREEFYRLPEVGGLHSPDVLVFRNPDATTNSEVRDLPKGERWWIDVVTAGMLRFPEVEMDEDGEGRYVQIKDRQLVEEKIRAVMRIVHGARKGKEKRGVILGAWGCGAYGNPVGEVARCWRNVLLGEEGGKNKTSRQTAELERERQRWYDMEIVFAIKERKLAFEFARYLDKDIEVEEDTVQADSEEDMAEDEEGTSQTEIQEKIVELENRIAGSRSDMQRDMLIKMLQKLKIVEDDDD